jgi:DNA-binding HxlR family transcriptional regulator
MKVRSNCPINLAAEVLSDAWSLAILRDIIFGDGRSFRDIRGHSLEGIATIILGAKLNKLVAEGLLTSAADPNHRQRAIYNLTKSPSHYHLRWLYSAPGDGGFFRRRPSWRSTIR